MTSVTQEMITAYVDGELDHQTASHVREAEQKDASIRDKISRYRALRAEVDFSFRSVMKEPIPAHMESLVQRQGASRRRGPSRERRGFFRSSNWAMPTAIAASLMIGVFAGGILNRGDQSDVRFAIVGDYSDEALHTLLLRQPSGMEIDGAAVLATYQNETGEICREFLLGKTSRLQGLSCRRADGAWSIVALSPSAPAGSYMLASGSDDAMFEAQLTHFVELSKDEERQLLENNWQD